MAQLERADKPYPPGGYPLVIVGSGPGALQLSYSLSRLGVRHAVISADESPGGMFRRWPLFQRMLSWTKPYTAVGVETREYERYDWNSLVSEEAQHRGVMTRVMDGSSYFPSRAEMEAGLASFAQETGVHIRYGCRWTSTRRLDDGSFVLETTDGEYATPLAVFAVGVADPWVPSSSGMEHARHYADVGAAESYRDRRVFIIGKQNSAFEIATGILPYARQIILASPRPAKLSVLTKSLVGVRARYVQPFEDHALGGGVFILDASIEEIAREEQELVVRTASSVDGAERTFRVDEVIAATGFVAPLLDLPRLGVATFGQSNLPAQTAFWESQTVPGVYFAGTVTQGSGGLKKHGIPSNSGAVHGHRYNARVLAHHLGRLHFGLHFERPQVREAELADFLLRAAAHAPELWHQRSYLAQVVSVTAHGAEDEGILPLIGFLESDGPAAIAITVEANPEGDIYPVAYARRGGVIDEIVLPPDALYDFETEEHRRLLNEALRARQAVSA